MSSQSLQLSALSTAPRFSTVRCQRSPLPNRRMTLAWRVFWKGNISLLDWFTLPIFMHGLLRNLRNLRQLPVPLRIKLQLRKLPEESPKKPMKQPPTAQKKPAAKDPTKEGGIRANCPPGSAGSKLGGPGGGNKPSTPNKTKTGKLAKRVPRPPVPRGTSSKIWEILQDKRQAKPLADVFTAVDQLKATFEARGYSRLDHTKPTIKKQAEFRITPIVAPILDVEVGEITTEDVDWHTSMITNKVAP